MSLSSPEVSLQYQTVTIPSLFGKRPPARRDFLGRGAIVNAAYNTEDPNVVELAAMSFGSGEALKDQIKKQMWIGTKVDEWPKHNGTIGDTEYSVHVPHVIGSFGSSYYVERARGIPLTGGSEKVDNEIVFLNGGVVRKIVALAAYFQFVDRLYDLGIRFRDHKSDSVFLDFSHEGVQLTVADVGGIQPVAVFDKTKQAMWDREISGRAGRYFKEDIACLVADFFVGDLGAFSINRKTFVPSTVHGVELEELIPRWLLYDLVQQKMVRELTPPEKLAAYLKNVITSLDKPDFELVSSQTQSADLSAKDLARRLLEHMSKPGM